jgi:NADPH-dependent 2,4-dienoyl-CoA reductase/sulfur reductase-like enzyme
VRVPLAIVGNGAAAAEAVLALRAHGYSGDIDLFADNVHAPYNPMLGTYLVSGAIPLERAFPFGDGRGFYGANRVTTHLEQAVVRLDALERTLTTADGLVYRYDRCLMASGARPSVPPIPGLREALAEPLAGAGAMRAEVATAEAPGSQTAAAGDPGRRVFTLQSLDDALGLKKAVDSLRSGGAKWGREPRGTGSPGGEAPRAAVLGASFAGVKTAAVLHEMGCKVCLVEKESSILPLSAHPECARLMGAHLLDQGYELRLGATVTGVGTDRSGARLDFGALPEEHVDLLVVCTGSRPALGFLTPGQVDVGVGILVDEQLRSNICTLYAAGDVAQGKNLLSGRHEMIGLWANARYQGRAAGRSLAGAPSEYRGSVPHNITRVGRMLFASIGCLKEYDRIETGGTGDTFQVRVWRDDRLTGVNLLNCCLDAGAMKQALLRAASGAVTETEATWTSFSA